MFGKRLIIWLWKFIGLQKTFLKKNFFALTNQLRRAVVSIPSNIAEGCGRGTNKEYAQFIQIAMGSAYEVDYQLLLSKDLGYIEKEEYEKLNDRTDKIKRQLASLLKKIRDTF
jgi:four helix bundle protein